MISVCAAYWKRQSELDRMVENFAAVYPDLDYELSICDDGSPEPAVRPESDRLILTHLPRKTIPLNPCRPLNVAVARSQGSLIVLTNPEIEHREPVLQAMAAMLTDPMDYVTCGCWDSRNVWLAGPLTDYGKRGRLPVPAGAHFHFCAMFTRTLWQEAGGFDEDYRNGHGCEDNDWLWRAWEAGANFKYCPKTVYHTPSRVSWGLPHNSTLFYRKWPEARRRERVKRVSA